MRESQILHNIHYAGKYKSRALNFCAQAAVRKNKDYAGPARNHTPRAVPAHDNRDPKREIVIINILGRIPKWK